MLLESPKKLNFVYPSTDRSLWPCTKWVSLRPKCFQDFVGNYAKIREIPPFQNRKRLYGGKKDRRDHSNATMEAKEALLVYQKTFQNGQTPSFSILLAALKACTLLRDLETGISIHAHVSDNGDDIHIIMATTLVHMYAKCGSMARARHVFDRMPQHDLVSWNAMIFGYAKSGENKCALHLFACMQVEGLAPNPGTYVAALKACANCAVKEAAKQVGSKVVKVQSLEKVKAIHSQFAKSMYASDRFVENTMVDVYGKCGSMVQAHLVFDKMFQPDIVSWNSLIFGYLESGENECALQLFTCLQEENLLPDPRTYVAALKACASCATKEDGKKVKGKLVKVQTLEKVLAIHSHLAKQCCEYDNFVANTLLDVYAKCGNMEHACLVFDKMPHHDLISWTAMIFGYEETMESKYAFKLFSCMQDEGFMPNDRTYVAILKACATCAANEGGKPVRGKLIKLESLEKGIAIHSQLTKRGCDPDIFVASTILDMYAKCGSMEHARRVFDRMPHHDLVSWTAMISAYSESGEGECTFQLFACMQDEGFSPLARTYVAVLKGCASYTSRKLGNQVEGKLVNVEALEKGMALHSQLAKNGYKSDIFVANTMVDMYANCGSMIHARGVFEEMLHHDLVSWNAMISGYAEGEESILALEFFLCMQGEGFVPDAQTYVAALKACGSLVALETGKKIHIQICSAGLQNDPFVAGCLVGFYGKCGSMADAEQVFDSMSGKTLVIWNPLLAGYAHHGDAQRVFDLFKIMQKGCLQADSITFLSILNACNHAGLVDKGKGYCWLMHAHYMLTPSIEHYTCIVDLFGRSNYLDDAVEVIKNMPFEPDLLIWKAVLGACRKWKNVVLGKHAFESVLRHDYKDASAYMLMTNIYKTGILQLSEALRYSSDNEKDLRKPAITVGIQK